MPILPAVAAKKKGLPPLQLASRPCVTLALPEESSPQTQTPGTAGRWRVSFEGFIYVREVRLQGSRVNMFSFLVTLKIKTF